MKICFDVFANNKKKIRILGIISIVSSCKLHSLQAFFWMFIAKNDLNNNSRIIWLQMQWTRTAQTYWCILRAKWLSLLLWQSDRDVSDLGNGNRVILLIWDSEMTFGKLFHTERCTLLSLLIFAQAAADAFLILFSSSLIEFSIL